MARLNFNELVGRKGKSLVQQIEEIKSNLEEQRFKWERIWHENSFFDDGYHYHVLSADTRQVVDQSIGASIYNPRRSIPKASRQIRGIINLLLANRPIPVVYPKTILKANFRDPQKMFAAEESARYLAQRTGLFILDEWKSQDLITDKLPYMMILAARAGVSYLKIYPDAADQKIRTTVLDAFDVFVGGECLDINDEPIVIESYPMLVSKIKANESFNEKVRQAVLADNKYSSSKVKDNYMQSRYGMKKSGTMTDTATIYEAYIKEYLDKDLIKLIEKQDDANVVLRGRQVGDPIIRQVISTRDAKEPLSDVYTTLPAYPQVSFQFEPGPLYNTPLLDRFKPANKSLDNTVSRLEKIVMTNASGRYWTRDDKKPIITNDASGEWITSSTKPEVLPNPEFSASAMQYIGLLTSYIEEQGVTTSALGKLPNDVRSGTAIESLKSSEYANLTIPLEQLKKTVGNIAKRILDIVDDYYITPQTVYLIEEGKPTYFDIIGQRGIELHKVLNQEKVVEDAIPITKNTQVDIEIESGLGYTIEGKRDNAQRIVEVIRSYAAEGYIPPAVVQSVIIEYLKTYQFGNLAQFTKAFDEFSEDSQLPEEQITKMKVAMAETMKDLGLVGPEAENQQVMSSQVGAAQALSDATNQ